MLWGGKARLFPQVKENDEKSAKIAVIHVACPQKFFFVFFFCCCWLVVCLLLFSSSFFFFLTIWQRAREMSAVHENECDAREKNTQPLALAFTPGLLFSYARLTMCKIEGNKQANIHAIFATFLTSFFPLPLQATSSSLLWLYFLSWRLYGAWLLFSLCLPFSFLNFLL